METLSKKVICGTWQFSKPEKYGYNEEHIFEVIEEVINHGVKYFDTSNNYGDGRAEEFLNRAEINKRKDIKIITKAGLTKSGRNGSADHILREFELSLKRLGKDSLDIYLLHWPDYNVGIRHSWETLLHLRESGLVDKIGLSNVTCEEIMHCHNLGHVDVIQNIYNPFSRDIEEVTIPYCKSNKISIMGYGALAHGFLNRNNIWDIQKNVPSDWRKNLPLYGEDYEKFHIVRQQLSELCDQFNYPFYQAIVEWITRDEGIDLAVVGWRTKKQVREFFQSHNEREKNHIVNNISEILVGLPDGCKIPNLSF